MKTEFSLAQLADPDIAEADKILRACVHCGFCTATCPTYVLLGDELDSPRGRIYLIKEMLEKDRPPTPEVVKSASAGRVTGTGNSATLSTADAAPGSPITVTVTVTDARGLSTGCQTVVNVLAVPVVVNEITEMGSCSFNDSRRPGRVDNVCKATLDDIALKIQREPNNTLVVVGYAEDEETVKATQLAGQRAVNVKYYLTKGEGGAKVDAIRVQPRSGADKTKTIKIYSVPPNMQVTETTTPVDETVVKPK
jgi:ferredoxin